MHSTRKATTTMAKSISVVVAAISLLLIPTSRAFVVVPPGGGSSTTRRANDDVVLLRPLGAKLEGREIEGALTPTNNFVLVRKAAILDKTDGGILLTGSAKIKKTEGKVISVGPGKTHPESGLLFPMPVVPGEGVVYGKYDGTEVDYDGDAHTLIRDDDILVKFSGEHLTLDTADVVSDNVLVRVEDNKDETASGLVIAATVRKGGKPSTGEVVKVGPGKMASNGEIMTVDISVGDMVKFRDFAGNEVDIEGGEYAVVKMTDILAKF